MRVEIGDMEAAALTRSKLVHVGLITVLVPLAVGTTEYSLQLVLLAFWLAGVAERASVSVANTCKEIAKVTGSVILGVVVFFVLLYSTW